MSVVYSKASISMNAGTCIDPLPLLRPEGLTLMRTPMTLGDIFPAKPGHTNYLINWSLKHKLIYVETPKVGCTTIKQILQFNELDGDSERLPSDIHDRSVSPLKAPSFDEELFISSLVSPDIFVFAFVRNPITRVLSAYLDKVTVRGVQATRIQRELGVDPAESVPSFEQFIDIVSEQSPKDMNPHWAPQCFLLGLPNVKYDYLGRFECFRESIEYLANRKSLAMPDPQFKAGREHATNAAAKVEAHYTKGALNKVHEIYKEDFERLGYGWGI